MIVVWSEPAKLNLRDIFERIAADSPSRAQRMIEKIIKRTRALSEYPMLGKTVPECPDDNVRQLVENPYRIIYEIQVEDEIVEILAVRHARQNFPPHRMPER